LAALVTGGIALSETNLTDLGKPSNSASPYLPLGSFRHTSVNPHAGKKPQLVFLGTQVDDNSAIERWAVVKALGEFGTFSAIRTLKTRQCEIAYGVSNAPTPGHKHGRLDCNSKVQSGGVGFGRPGGAASFDLRAARFHSPYVALAAAELIDRNLKTKFPTQLTGSQRALFDRYIHLPADRKWHDAVWHAVPLLYESLTFAHSGRQLPLVAVGGYVETGANVALAADLLSSDRLSYLSFSQILKTLRTGKSVEPASDTLAPDVNAEANMITALVCHADGLKPARVCNRAVIRSMLKHVK
jgi:hypothetical protein